MVKETLEIKNKNSKNPDTNSFDVEKIKLQMKRWQEKLLDMNRSNPLLGLNRSRSAKLKISKPDINALFKSLVFEENELKLPFVKKIRKKSEDQNQATLIEEKDIYKIEEGDIDIEIDSPINLKRKLRRIYDNSRSTIEERGVITLFMTFGVVAWNDDILGESISPILLVPCELVYKGPNIALRIHRSDEEIRINPAIIYYFREKHKLDISASPFLKKIILENVIEEFDENSLKTIFKEIQEVVAEQRWTILNEVWLGTFSFESLVLYQDLKLLTDKACSSLLIAAFSHAIGRSEDIGESLSLSDELDSLEIPEVIPVACLPTDSSQLKALAYAASGNHLVIHGPPGTGKSQTISNIITDALGKNKKVLFVSSKMAALNVVFDRLKKEGFGQFCLEAHGTKAGKLKIIEELKRTLESDELDNINPLSDELESLKNTRSQLNDYVCNLHSKVEPFGISIYEAIGEFFQLQNIRDIKFNLPWQNILEVTKEEVRNCIDALNRLSQLKDLFAGREKNAWRGFSFLEYNLALQEKIESDLRFLSKNLLDISGMLKNLNKFFTDQEFSFEDLFSLIPVLSGISTLKKLPENWSNEEIEETEKKRGVFNEALLLVKEFNEKISFYNGFSSLSFKEAVRLLDDIKNFDRWTTRISIKYFSWKKKLKNELKEKVNLSYKNIKNYYEVSKRLLNIEDWFIRIRELLEKEVSAEDLRNQKKFEEVIRGYEVVILLKNNFPKNVWKDSKITIVDSQLSNSAAALVSSLKGNINLINEVASRIDKWWPNGFIHEVLLLQTPIKNLSNRIEEVLNNLNGLRDWVILQKAIKYCRDLGLEELLRSIKNSEGEILEDIFEKRLLRLWISAAISLKPCLADFTTIKQEELIGKFRMLDARIQRLSNIQMKSNAASTSRMVKIAQSGLGSGSEIGTLRFEMQKRKRIKPLRKLFSEIPHVLQALKPCMLMSPISVSTFLKPETFHFDLVIFDEASQLPTPQAIPSILRADQVIVAGDQNQLPPTSFFDVSLIGEDDEEDYEENFATSLESLLDDCIASVPVFKESYLKWHYRSRDERLISFSNNYFYDNKLITFPSPCKDKVGRGIKLEYTAEGVWDRGRSRTNRIEARRAAKLAIEHFAKFPERSLGIVALNTYQREAIEDSISEELSRRPDLLPFFDSSRQEPFFVKSLENVQGDERDVIIISVGYGKSPGGDITLNFGPLNMQGGWRRLNVLVTRAKWQIILITSLRSSELGRLNPQNRGALALKNFIEYAEREGSLPVDPARITEGETNDFEDSIRVMLVERGFDVDCQVGTGSFRIDLAIKNPKDPSKYLVGIECDGATYHSSRIARDRDLLREEILRGMGWKIYRVWSTDWFQNQDNAIKQMIDKIESLLSKKGEKAVTGLPITKENLDLISVPPVPPIKKYKSGSLYVKYEKRLNRKTLLNRNRVYQLENILIELIRAEGPIHEDILKERLKEVFRVKKIGANINSNVEEAIKLAISTKSIERKKGFMWKRGVEMVDFRLPSEGAKRTISNIAPQEIALAILFGVEDQFGIMREQVPQIVFKIFKLNRTTPEEIDQIREVTDSLIDDGKLVLNGYRVNLP